jgi:hypothetical protein
MRGIVSKRLRRDAEARTAGRVDRAYRWLTGRRTGPDGKGRQIQVCIVLVNGCTRWLYKQLKKLHRRRAAA